ncbi:MAG: glycosyltransferase family 9 protein [Bacteroidetes bacterium]|nr:glycosyltransferase family 9 protein [Bacteroidota bacterium]
MRIDDLHAANLTKFEASKYRALPKFLLIRFSSIGDIVLTSPVIRCLKEQVPGAEVHFLTRSNFKMVLEHHPQIDKLWTSDGSLDDVAEDLKKEKYDAVIDLHHNVRTLKLKRLLKVKSFSFRKLNIEKWLLVNLHINRMPPIHIVDRYLETVASFNVKNDQQGLDFYPEPGAEKVLDRLPPSHQNGFVAIAIGAQHTTKMMPSEKIGRVVKLLKMPVVLLGGKEDKVRGKQVEMAAGAMVWNACGLTSLGESAELLKAAKVVLTHDTGLMHIASSFKKPIVSVWGNTVPAFGMYPYLPGHENLSKIMEVKDLKCRPCTKIGFDKCPKGHFQCMRGIEEERIVEAIKSFL